MSDALKPVVLLTGAAGNLGRSLAAVSLAHAASTLRSTSPR